MKSTANKIVNTVKSTAKQVQQVANTLKSTAKKVANTISTKVKGAFQSLADMAKQGLSKIQNTATSLVQGAKTLIENTSAKVKNAVQDAAAKATTWWDENKESAGRIARGALAVLGGALIVAGTIGIVVATGGAAAPLVVGGLIGAASNVGGKIVSDVARGATTGNWDHVNGWDYFGAAVGGFVGGALAATGVGSTMSGMVTGGVTNFVSTGSRALVSPDEYTFGDVLESTVTGMATGAFFGAVSETMSIVASNNQFGVPSSSPNYGSIGLDAFAREVGREIMEGGIETAYDIIQG